MKNALTILALALTVPASAAPAVNSDTEFARTVNAAEAVSVQAAQELPHTAVIRDETTNVSVDLNAKTVKCSAADYSMPMLKVLVPGLADITLLNHRNTREGAPCIAAGQCTESLGPQSILKSGEGTERIPVRVVLKKVTKIEGEVCRVSLVETVTTQVRGLHFFHERYQQVADRTAADCR
jgi:hypothetical protein